MSSNAIKSFDIKINNNNNNSPSSSGSSFVRESPAKKRRFRRKESPLDSVTSSVLSGEMDDQEPMLFQIRQLALACSTRFQHGAAAWYAEKAVTLTEGTDAQDIYTLAKAYYANCEYSRCLHVLEMYKMLDIEKLQQQQQVNIAAAAHRLQLEEQQQALHAGIVKGAHKGDNNSGRRTRGRGGRGEGSSENTTHIIPPPLLPIPSSSSPTSPSPQQLFGAVPATSLRFFYLAGLCYAAMKQWERCIILLESCMEGRGHAGLRVPLRSVETSTPSMLDSLAAAAAASAGALSNNAAAIKNKKNTATSSAKEGGGGGVPPPRIPSIEPSLLRSPLGSLPTNNNMHSHTSNAMNNEVHLTENTAVSATASKISANSGSIPGLDGPLQGTADAFYTTTTTTATIPASAWASASSSPFNFSNTVTSTTNSVTSSDGLRVWAILLHMALQHSPASAAVAASIRNVSKESSSSAAGGASTSSSSLYPTGYGYEGPQVTEFVPASLLSLNTPAGHVPISDGSSLNIVACMCSLRGNALLATDNRLRAAQWYLAAIRLDPYSSSAFQVLVENHLLTDEEETKVMSYLQSALGIPYHLLLQPSKKESSGVNQKDATVAGNTTKENASAAATRAPPGATTTTAERARHGSRSTSVSTTDSMSTAGASITGGDDETTNKQQQQNIRSRTRSSANLTSPSSTSSSRATSGTRPGGETQPTATTSMGRGNSITRTGSTLTAPTASSLMRSQSMRSVKRGTHQTTAASSTTTSISTPKPTAAMSRSSRTTSRTNTTPSTTTTATTTATDSNNNTVDDPANSLLMPSLDTDIGAVLVDDNDDDEDDNIIGEDDHKTGANSGSGSSRSSRLTSSIVPSSYTLVDNTWLLHLYGCRLNRYAIGLGRNIQDRFAGLEGSVLNLGTSVDVLAAKAEALLCQHDPGSAVTLTRRVMSMDPHHRGAAAIHYASLVALRKSAELFQAAHAAVDTAPRDAMSWYAVGCYYMAVNRAGAAVRHFTKSVQLDSGFAPAWVSLGLAYAAQEENEPALQACRTALRLYPASHIPPLAMASLCQKTGAIALARQYIDMATARCPHDPGVYHEAGVLEYKNGNYVTAHGLFTFATTILSSIPLHLRNSFEATYVNLGHASRKLGKYEEAIAAYGDALALAPGKPSTLASLAFTYQLAGDPDSAATRYHAALARVPDDSFCQRMLRVALQDMLEASSARQALAAAAAAATAVAEQQEQYELQRERQQQQGGGGGDTDAMSDVLNTANAYGTPIAASSMMMTPTSTILMQSSSSGSSGGGIGATTGATNTSSSFHLHNPVFSALRGAAATPESMVGLARAMAAYATQQLGSSTTTADGSHTSQQYPYANLRTPGSAYGARSGAVAAMRGIVSAISSAAMQMQHGSGSAGGGSGGMGGVNGLDYAYEQEEEEEGEGDDELGEEEEEEEQEMEEDGEVDEDELQQQQQHQVQPEGEEEEQEEEEVFEEEEEDNLQYVDADDDIDGDDDTNEAADGSAASGAAGTSTRSSSSSSNAHHPPTVGGLHRHLSSRRAMVGVATTRGATTSASRRTNMGSLESTSSSGGGGVRRRHYDEDDDDDDESAGSSVLDNHHMHHGEGDEDEEGEEEEEDVVGGGGKGFVHRDLYDNVPASPLSDDGDRNEEEDGVERVAVRSSAGFVPASSLLLRTPSTSAPASTSVGGVIGAGGRGSSSGGDGNNDDNDDDAAFAARLQAEEFEEAHATAVALAASGVELHISQHGALMVASPEDMEFGSDEDE